jgi:hypothetical protein
MSTLKVIEQDILTVERPAIIGHCCNTLGVMGGLAEQIANKYPKAFTKYKSDLKRGHTLGMSSVYETEDNLLIFSMLTQSTIGTYTVQTDIDALDTCLNWLKLCTDSYRYQVYFPYYLGSGLAGGPTKETKADTWKKVSELISAIIPSAVICKLPS